MISTPRRWRRIDLLLYLALAACGGGTTDAGGGAGSITASANPTTIVAFIGGTATGNITVTRSGYSAPLTINSTLTGFPSGVTATFDPPTLTGSTLSSTVTVTVAPDASPGGGNINLLIIGPDSVNTFLAIPLRVGRPQVTVIKDGSGAGTVTSSPAGINCGTTCTSAFVFGTSVTLTASPAAGSSFGGWTGGGCSGTTTTCTIAVTAAPSVTATFNTTAQGFSFTVSPTTASVSQGGGSTATATFSRANGFAGGIAVTSTGAPAGLTIAANPASATGNTATLDI
ncbi:MAG TPA: hypothetical protein VN651_06855, partial [Gemmatimonadaceae bacterium]|nr:hypothetical protein [Gemmatimonadaceae bacterium]